MKSTNCVQLSGFAITVVGLLFLISGIGCGVKMSSARDDLFEQANNGTGTSRRRLIDGQEASWDDRLHKGVQDRKIQDFNTRLKTLQRRPIWDRAFTWEKAFELMKQECDEVKTSLEDYARRHNIPEDTIDVTISNDFGMIKYTGKDTKYTPKPRPNPKPQPDPTPPNPKPQPDPTPPNPTRPNPTQHTKNGDAYSWENLKEASWSTQWEYAFDDTTERFVLTTTDEDTTEKFKIWQSHAKASKILIILGAVLSGIGLAIILFTVVTEDTQSEEDYEDEEVGNDVHSAQNVHAVQYYAPQVQYKHATPGAPALDRTIAIN